MMSNKLEPYKNIVLLISIAIVLILIGFVLYGWYLTLQVNVTQIVDVTEVEEVIEDQSVPETAESNLQEARDEDSYETVRNKIIKVQELTGQPVIIEESISSEVSVSSSSYEQVE